MGYIDYSKEGKRDIAFIDMKSFYASVECVKRGLNPLTTCLCVMSRADNSNGLILASSPTFKKVFGKSNVGRSHDLPFDIETRKFKFEWARKNKIVATKELVEHIESWAERTLIVLPRMNLYIEENLKIIKVLKNYAPPTDIHPYSIDEAFIDLTDSLNYFIKDATLSRKKKLDLVSAKIQREIWEATGVYSTVGMSNSNPLLAKLALDNEAKKTTTMRANWSYEDVETKVWNIKNMTDFWGIGHRTAERLKKLGIHSIRDLANSNPDILKREFGIVGVQLWFHSNGVDESRPSKPYRPRSTGIGNSQVLPRNYENQTEIELVLGEMAEQVAIRLRKQNLKAQVVAIHVGYSRHEKEPSISTRRTIEATNSTSILQSHVISLFRERYSGGAVRNVAVSYDKLIPNEYSTLSFFEDSQKLEKNENLENAIDEIRNKFGFLSVQKASSLLKGSRVIDRSKLVGGHRGGLDGME